MRSSLSLIAVLLLFAGCSTKPVTTPKLQQAQHAFETLQGESSVQREAPEALLQAGRIYDLSRQAKSREEADHLAYLLSREVEVTRAQQRQTELRRKIAALKAQKQQALLEAKESEVARLRKQMAETKAKLRELEALNAKETNRGLVLTLGDVLFESGKATLLPGAQRTLQKLVVFLEENPERNVLIEGHTDNVGSSTYNLDLSLRRAEAVRQALIEAGIGPDRIAARGYGERYPVAPNSDAAGRQRNRRVEIVILNEGVSPESAERGDDTVQ